ncbi:MAG: hypothetical protein R3C11_14630 [Planctomycetaceae bacterium]
MNLSPTIEDPSEDEQGPVTPVKRKRRWLRVVVFFGLVLILLGGWQGWASYRHQQKVDTLMHATLEENPWGIKEGMSPDEAESLLTNVTKIEGPSGSSQSDESGLKFGRSYQTEQIYMIMLGFERREEKDSPAELNRMITGRLKIPPQFQPWYLRWLPSF